MTRGKFSFCGHERPKAGDEAGQALIELAISLPLLVMILVGSAEFARLAFAAIEVSGAARAAAQYGALNNGQASDQTGIAAAASNDAPDLVGLSTTSSTAGVCSDHSACTGPNSSCTLGTDCVGSRIETIVTVHTQIQWDPGFHLAGMGGNFTLRGHAVQKVAP